ncbi:MAG: MarR family transcriptional regulator [Terrimicrobiaceae bacterium]|nr:MarR family transcriptional regulator [Terrimicrobiaceae bacterium]
MIADEEFAISTESIGRLADIILSLQRCFLARLSETLAAGQVSSAQFFLLSHINTHETLSMTEIAAKMSHTTAAATGLVDRLERLDYVERTTDPLDRRKVLVRIKPKGVDLVALIRQDMMANLSKVMRGLSPHEQIMWVQIYDKVFNYCQTHADTCIPSAD